MQQRSVPETFVYIVQADPHAPTPDVEDEHLLSVGVSVTWSNNTLFHCQLDPSALFHLGPPTKTGNVKPDPTRDRHFLLPVDVLGRASVGLLRPTGDGSSVDLSSLPTNARFELAAGPDVEPSELFDLCRSRGWSTEEGHLYWPLAQGALRVHLGAFTVDCAVTKAAKNIPRALLSQTSSESLVYFGLSFASAAAILASIAFFTPPLSLTGGENIDRNDLILMQQYLDAASERERETQPAPGETGQDDPSGESGKPAEATEGAMGDPETAARNRRYAVKGPPDNPDPHLAKLRALEQAATFGVIGLLSAGGDVNAPTAPWGRDESLGTEAQNALGVMWADDIGQAAGGGGLGISGPGLGGGGPGEGIGIGAIGTFNRGMGPSGEYGIGSHHGRLPGTHQNKGFRMRTATPQVSGRLPPQIIQRIVRQNHGRFRLCYERGLAANPSLSGRVTVRFVIGRNGAVSNATNGGSSLASSDVTHCVVRAFYGLSFPKPEGGLVTVSYPIAFSPD